METPALVFIGFMGAGKTTGARAAAARAPVVVPAPMKPMKTRA